MKVQRSGARRDRVAGPLRPALLGLACLAAAGHLVGSDPAQASAPAAARPGAAGPGAASEIAVDEKIGARLPEGLSFTDQRGRPRPLSQLFGGERPVLLTMAYFRCPMLCDLVLNGLAQSLARVGFVPGRDYDAVTVSIDPKDTPGAAAHKQMTVLQKIGHPEAGGSWPFLVSPGPEARRLADAVGFRYVHDEKSDLYAHPAVAVVMTPDGRIARYLYGVSLRPLDIRLALTEAADGQVGGFTERLLLTCFRYDPATRRYGFFVSAVLKGGSALVLLATGIGLALLWRRDDQRRRRWLAERRRDPSYRPGRER